MAARVIACKNIAAMAREETRSGVISFKNKYGYTPKLKVVMVGNDPASASYIRGKELACAEVGISSSTINLPLHSTNDMILRIIDEVNNNPDTHGILVQLPLPNQVDQRKIINSINPHKDVDGLHPNNLGLLMSGSPRFIPATPLGIQYLLIKDGVHLDGAEVVICGRSTLVGRPLAELLTQASCGGNSTVTVCHSRTRHMEKITSRADVLVSAIGRPGTITGRMVKPGAVVIDVGITRIEDNHTPHGYRLVGDVVFKDVSKVASAITKVPGGIGPLTIAMLLRNVLTAALISRNH